jgi:phage tail-like protein
MHWQGLELLEDGSLALQSLPLFAGVLPDELAGAAAPQGPAGIAVDPEGAIYFSQPERHRVMRTNACDPGLIEVVCEGGPTATCGLNQPRGILWHEHRQALLVADSANHRVYVYAWPSFQLVDIWGGAIAGAGPGLLDGPWSLASDMAGNVYVVDYNNRTIRKFNLLGDPDLQFSASLQQSSPPLQPSDIAVYSDSMTTRLFVIDQGSRQIKVYEASGKPGLDAGDKPVQFGDQVLQKPMGIAATREAIFVGDNGLRRVLAFRNIPGFPFIGEAVGYQGPVAALGLDLAGNLLVHSGTDAAPLALAVAMGHVRQGALWSDPIRVGPRLTTWHSLRATLEPLDAGAHIRLLVATSNDTATPPAVNPGAANPFSDPKWRPAISDPDPLADVPDLFIGGAPSGYLWVAALLVGDGVRTPVLSELKVEYDHKTYLDYLPAIYKGDTPCGDFLLRFVSLFESMFQDVEDEIAGLPRLFDPAATPAKLLPWLASWLALDLDEDWDEAFKRKLIAEAFELYGRRGTVAGLIEALRLFAGVDAVIEEPILQNEWWALPAEEIDPCASSSCGCQPGFGDAACSCGCAQPAALGPEKKWGQGENSVLGFTTRLASAELEGAVLGSTAILDRSTLITDAELGAPLFDEVAFRFSVLVHRHELKCAGTLQTLQAVIEREKPAHTAYHLCVVEPGLRVGFQARVGIDAVVAGPPEPAELGGQFQLNAGALGGRPSGRLGEQSRIGVSTVIG